MQVLRTMWNNFVNKSSSSIKYDTIFQLNSIDDAAERFAVVAVGVNVVYTNPISGCLFSLSYSIAPSKVTDVETCYDEDTEYSWKDEFSDNEKSRRSEKQLCVMFSVSTVRADCDYLKFSIPEMTRFSSLTLGLFGEILCVLVAERTHTHTHTLWKTFSCVSQIDTNNMRKLRLRSEKVGIMFIFDENHVCAFRRRNYYVRKIFSPNFEKDVASEDDACYKYIDAPSQYAASTHRLRVVGAPLTLCQSISFFSRSNMSSINFLFHLLSKISISFILHSRK